MLPKFRHANQRKWTRFATRAAVVLFLSSCGGTEQNASDPDPAQGESVSLTQLAQPHGQSARVQRNRPGIILVPGATTNSWSTGLTVLPLNKLKRRLEKAGYNDVQILEYPNNLRVPRGDIEHGAISSLEAILDKNDKNYDIIAHSMGHYVALAAILKSERSDRIRKVIGLAGAAHGGDSRPPIGCGAFFGSISGSIPEEVCPGIDGLFRSGARFIVDDFYESYADELKQLDKCSLAVENDLFLQPNDSGFFADGKNFTIDFARHANLPASRKLIGFLQKNCGL